MESLHGSYGTRKIGDYGSPWCRPMELGKYPLGGSFIVLENEMVKIH